MQSNLRLFNYYKIENDMNPRSNGSSENPQNIKLQYKKAKISV